VVAEAAAGEGSSDGDPSRPRCVLDPLAILEVRAGEYVGDELVAVEPIPLLVRRWRKCSAGES
jgi:hypothetical protein